MEKRAQIFVACGKSLMRLYTRRSTDAQAQQLIAHVARAGACTLTILMQVVREDNAEAPLTKHVLSVLQDLHPNVAYRLEDGEFVLEKLVEDLAAVYTTFCNVKIGLGEASQEFHAMVLEARLSCEHMADELEQAGL